MTPIELDRLAQRIVEAISGRPVSTHRDQTAVAVVRAMIESELLHVHADADQAIFVTEEERDEATAAAWYAFVAGAKWWEWDTTNGTMWNSDTRRVEDEAKKRYPYAPHGLVRAQEIRAEHAEAACAAMRAAIEAVVSAGCTPAAFRRHCIPALALAQDSTQARGAS